MLKPSLSIVVHRRRHRKVDSTRLMMPILGVLELMSRLLDFKDAPPQAFQSVVLNTPRYTQARHRL